MAADLKPEAPFAAPVVDHLSVRVVVDSVYEKFIRDATHPAVRIEHLRQVPGRQMSTLAGEWGLSLHLESAGAGSKAQYLLDFGYTPEVLTRNFDLLDIDEAKIDGLILSHGHRDHYGGLAGFVDHYRSHMKDDLALFVGADDAFREKWIKGPNGEIMSWGALDRTALTAQMVAPVCCGTPHVLAGAFTSGYIERDSFEKVSGGSMIDPEEHFTAAERAGKLVQDTHPEEHATCYVVKGKGLVVISSCGHAGIINSVRTAMKIANVDRLHAVMGGFHLSPAPPDYVDHTIDELERLKPDVVVPMHCTGAAFIESMRRRMPDRLVTSNIGTRFTFGV